MKAEFYLTLLDGLLATAVYYPRKQARGGGPGQWTATLGEVTRSTTILAASNITSIPGPCRPPVLPAGGLATSATPVCGYRMALHR